MLLKVVLLVAVIVEALVLENAVVEMDVLLNGKVVTIASVVETLVAGCGASPCTPSPGISS